MMIGNCLSINNNYLSTKQPSTLNVIQEQIEPLDKLNMIVEQSKGDNQKVEEDDWLEQSNSSEVVAEDWFDDGTAPLPLELIREVIPELEKGHRRSETQDNLKRKLCWSEPTRRRHQNRYRDPRYRDQDIPNFEPRPRDQKFVPRRFQTKYKKFKSDDSMDLDDNENTSSQSSSLSDCDQLKLDSPKSENEGIMDAEFGRLVKKVNNGLRI